MITFSILHMSIAHYRVHVCVFSKLGWLEVKNCELLWKMSSNIHRSENHVDDFQLNPPRDTADPVWKSCGCSSVNPVLMQRFVVAAAIPLSMGHHHCQHRNPHAVLPWFTNMRTAVGCVCRGKLRTSTSFKEFITKLLPGSATSRCSWEAAKAVLVGFSCLLWQFQQPSNSVGLSEQPRDAPALSLLSQGPARAFWGHPKTS